ncbi:spore gernimation protein GerPD [Bacillus sp. B15-48]|uniref:spore gernimation protein GerPD n=1 Tax=Bacillus sp. B15-48 TaxID=1548601 RepID=UPI00193FCD19|nr:spore gernimation protein GerPD [Bacillus sp. B15-48]MBM4764198.1 spore gernimation protein GerPD [Bacillus sp. B15-48]
MIYNVYNRDLSVGDIKITAVASSAIFLIGDAETIQLASTFDTPPESLIIGPFVPLAPEA